jgi:hypothetical protein
MATNGWSAIETESRLSIKSETGIGIDIDKSN